jgi:hypothetical protein
MFKKIFILPILFILPFLSKGQNGIKLLNYFNSNSIRETLLLPDSTYLVIGTASPFILRFDANFNLLYSKQLKSKDQNNIYSSHYAKGNSLICGELFSSLPTKEFKYPFISELNACYENTWSKLFVFHDVFKDTDIINNSAHFRYAASDNDDFLYIISNYEEPYKLEGPRFAPFIYKFAKNGEFIWRKPTMKIRNLDMSVTSFNINNNNLIYSAYSWFQYSIDKPNLFALRGVFGAFDTTGKSIGELVFINDTFLTNSVGHLSIPSTGKNILINYKGSSNNPIKGYTDEDHLIVLDSNFQIKSKRPSTSRDSLFYINMITAHGKDSNFWVIRFMQNPKSGGDYFKRKNTPYLFKFNHTLDVLDSFELSFFKTSNFDDTTVYCYQFFQHPVIDSAFVFVGNQVFRSIIQNVFVCVISKTGRLLDVQVPLSTPDPLCPQKVSSGQIPLNFGNNDTLHFYTYYNRNFYDPPTSLIENNLEEKNIKFYPNPTNGIVQYESEEPLVRLEVFDTKGQAQYIVFNPEQEQFDMTGLASGTYLIRFENKKGKSGTIRLKKD